MKKILFTLGLVIVLIAGACTEEDDTADVGAMAGKIGLKLDEESFSFTVGDGISDFISDIQFLGLNQGDNRQWLVTDESSTILLIFDTLGELKEYDFESSAAGKSLLWYLRYNGELQGVEVGSNAGNISGDFELSNAIEINSNAPISNAGSIEGGPFNFVVGDRIEDKIPEGAITQSGTVSGANTTWIITDSDTKILGLPATLENVENNDFDGADPGDCLLWFAAYEGDVVGLKKGELAADIIGDFSLSNSITVTRTAFVKTADAGDISGGPFIFNAVDGTEDKIPAASITQSGTVSGSTQTWIITDPSNIILALPTTLAEVEAYDFEGGDLGDCSIWYASYEGNIDGLAVGEDATAVSGDFDLSNAVTVTKSNGDPPTVFVGPVIAGGPYAFTVGAGIKNIKALAASSPSIETLTRPTAGSATPATVSVAEKWLLIGPDSIVKANAGGAKPVRDNFDFEAAGPGTYLIYKIVFEAGKAPTNIVVGDDFSGISGDYALSNVIEVIVTN